MDCCPTGASCPTGDRSSSNDDVTKNESLEVNDANTDWVDLTGSAKAWSRLLYPNPVCLLCTRQKHGESSSSSSSSTRDNVMVLSWLTAVDNAGRFMFSICERRWTTQVLRQQQQQKTADVLPVKFVLSIPVAGMEALVKDIGSVSGRHCNKFEHTPHESEATESTSCPPTSKRLRRKRLQREGNITGLRGLPFGSLFGIAGCVAHLQCHIVQIVEKGLVDDHLLVVAQVETARVHKNYWDATKLLFRPTSPETPPFLSFLGSQTFGYVVTTSDRRTRDAPCEKQHKQDEEPFHH